MELEGSVGADPVDHSQKRRSEGHLRSLGFVYVLWHQIIGADIGVDVCKDRAPDWDEAASADGSHVADGYCGEAEPRVRPDYGALRLYPNSWQSAAQSTLDG